MTLTKLLFILKKIDSWNLNKNIFSFWEAMTNEHEILAQIIFFSLFDYNLFEFQ